MTGFVYLIRNQDLYKIGITQNLNQRMSQLKPDEIIAVLETKNFEQLEKDLHQRYSDARIPQSEYFRLTDSQLENISINAKEIVINDKYNSIFSEENIEDVVVVGSQIKGASITGALPVTVISSEDIDILGVEDGTELLENMTEQGLNYFTEAESDSGGVNSARGDVGAYNIRNMGVGNTLILLNGRRLVNNAGYQTELLGGDYVPTMSVNSNLIPTTGLERVEVLKDGASAIYGADAVAGVVNNVLQSDFDGFEVALRNQGYDNFSAVDDRLTLKWGKDMNGGKTNVSLMYDFYDRDGIAAAEDPRWGDSDHRKWIPADSLWAGDTSFRNLYSGKWAQLDMRGRTDYSDSSGEIQIIPIGDPRCARSDSKDTGYGTCLAVDTTTMANGEYYINPGQFRDYRGELERSNLFVFVNHELDNGSEFFAEIGHYNSDYMRHKEPAGDFSTALLSIGPDNYWMNQIGMTADNSSTNKQVRIDNWRPCLLYTSPSPRDLSTSRMPSSA